MIRRNTVIPTKKSQVISTWEDNQQTVSVRIYEGERPTAKDNHYLGEFSVSGIPPAPRGQPQVEITFEIDSNGILNVAAEDKGTGKSEKITVTNDKGRLSEEDIEHMIRDAEKFKAADKDGSERMWARHALSEYLGALSEYLSAISVHSNVSASYNFSDFEQHVIHEAMDNGTQWLLANLEAEPERTREEKARIEAVCSPIFQKFYDEYVGGGGVDDEGDAQNESTTPKRLTDLLFYSIQEEL